MQCIISRPPAYIRYIVYLPTYIICRYRSLKLYLILFIIAIAFPKFRDTRSKKENSVAHIYHKFAYNAEYVMHRHFSSVGVHILLLAATILAMSVNHSKATNMDIHGVPVHVSSYPHIMAHRGCCANGFGGHAPKNTIPAFQYAHSVGAMMFETNLLFVSEWNIVIMYDNTLDCTTNCRGVISNWTLVDIQNQCEAGS